MTGPEITELDAQTVERIAAGEVVERPASAVKELLENALDADASRVTVAVEGGGAGSLRVSDDGVGMSEGTVRRAVEKHTTSKIGDIDDLESGVGTLGFRGEALHAIGAVSRLTITTRPRDTTTGTELTVEGGEVTDVSPAGCPEGTTVEVEDLFYNVPARRKYLKQESTEFDHINRIVTNYALANPGVAVTLEHDGRETFATNGTGDLRETVLAVYGREVAASMIDLDDTADGPLDGLSGLVSHPETNRASRDYCSTFVNGRYVTANGVRDAVFEAYGSQLAGDRYPFAVVFLEVDPADVDVNVHPRKLDVRFAAEEAVGEQIEATVEAALLREGLLRSSAPRGVSAPDQATIEPGSTDTDDTQTDGDRGDSTAGQRATDRTGDTTTTRITDEQPATDSAEQSTGSTHPESDEKVGGAGDRETGEREGQDGQEPSSPAGDESASRFEAGEQKRLVEGTPTDREFDSLPSLRVLGQLQDTYIVAETDDGLVLIDQHAADERVNYERLRGSLTGDVTTQALADPVEIELTAREAELFDEHEPALAKLGFQAARTGERTVEVRTVPSLVAEAADPALLRDVLGEFVAGEAAAAATVEAAADELLADLACYPSITGNTSLTEGSVLELLEALGACSNPYACPHGRPVIVEFDSDELEARFERDYPGHQG